MMSDDPADVELDTGAPAPPPSPPAIEPPRRRLLIPLVVVAGLGLALSGAYLYFRSRQPVPTASPGVERPQPDRRGEPGDQIVLPPLEASDPLVRELVGQLSSHPVVAAWLATDGLILNFAVVTTRIVNGESPAQELRAIGPVPPFRPRASREDLFVDVSSYRRYDRYAEAVSALDARGTARLYATLRPRIVEAYQRMGTPPEDVDAVLERAIVELLRVPVVEGPIELAPSGIVYAFVDPELEGLSAAQKHLLRMGPRNVQIIQGKLREIADYLAIPASRLPRAP
jgi:hypothetical protein